MFIIRQGMSWRAFRLRARVAHDCSWRIILKSRWNAAMKVFVTGLSYKTAPVEVRERLAVRPSLCPALAAG